MNDCPTRDELVRLLDGELTENRAAAVRAHAAGCTPCEAELAALRSLVADLARPIAPPAGAADRVLARLRAEAIAPAPVHRARGLVIAAGALAAAATAALVLRGGSDDPVARGGSPTGSFARRVDVGLYASGPALNRLRDGDAVAADTAFAISYRNPGAAVYAMVFAVDGAGELSWIAPAYLSAHDDPVSLALATTATDTVLPDATVLDAPGPAAVRVFVVITTNPLHVSQVEAMAGSLDERSLRRRWPDADIRSFSLRFTPRRQP